MSSKLSTTEIRAKPLVEWTKKQVFELSEADLNILINHWVSQGYFRGHENATSLDLKREIVLYVRDKAKKGKGPADEKKDWLPKSEREEISRKRKLEKELKERAAASREQNNGEKKKRGRKPGSGKRAAEKEEEKPESPKKKKTAASSKAADTKKEAAAAAASTTTTAAATTTSTKKGAAEPPAAKNKKAPNGKRVVSKSRKVEAKDEKETAKKPVAKRSRK